MTGKYICECGHLCDEGQNYNAPTEMLAALKALVDACGAVRPLSNDVSVEKVTDVRRAMKFMEAVDAARAVIAKAEEES